MTKPNTTSKLISWHKKQRGFWKKEAQGFGDQSIVALYAGWALNHALSAEHLNFLQNEVSGFRARERALRHRGSIEGVELMLEWMKKQKVERYGNKKLKGAQFGAKRAFSELIEIFQENVEQMEATHALYYAEKGKKNG